MRIFGSLSFAVSLVFALAAIAVPSNTAFTYQGRLAQDDAPAGGTYNLQFAIFDSDLGGVQLGTVTNTGVNVSNGLFTVTLDFGPGVFDGGARWVEIGVQSPGAPGFTILSPRQPVTATPYALQAATASVVPTTNLTGMLPDGLLGGTYSAVLNFMNATNSFAGNGSGLTGLNASALSSGTISRTRLPSTVAQLDRNQAFSGMNIFVEPVLIGRGEAPGDALLDVVGPLRLNNFDLYLRHLDNRVDGLGWYGSGKRFLDVPVNGPVLYGYDGGALGSLAGRSLAIRWTGEGRVGVGTANPQSLLDVNGDISAEGTVTAAGFQGPGVITWQTVSNATQTAAPNRGYVVDYTAEATITLPASAAVGDVVRITGAGDYGWRLAQNAGQKIVTRSLAGGGWLWSACESNRNWQALAASSDGRKLVAAVRSGTLYNSTDGGMTWTAREANRIWSSVACSADGSRWFAAAYRQADMTTPGRLYQSTDSGVTWTQNTTAPAGIWNAIACSADGMRLVMVADGGTAVHMSDNGGSTWRTWGATRNYGCAAISANGAVLLAGDSLDGLLYVSTDYGATWNGRATNRIWVSAACSADGNTIIAAARDNFLYVSTDAGLTWQTRESARSWQSVACSADGTRMIAAASSNRLYLSSDGGNTWFARESVRNWRVAAMTPDGTKMFAGVYGGRLYRSMPFTTADAAGGLKGDANTAIELQHVGNGTWVPLSSAGTIVPY